MQQQSKLIQNHQLHDILELPWKKSFILMMRPKSIRNIFDDYHSQFSEFLQEHYHVVEGLTLLDPFRLENNLKLLKKVASIDGDIVECGCFKGGNAILMALWLQRHQLNKKIILFDSFEGLPEPDHNLDSGYKAGQFSASLDVLNETINKLNLNHYFEIHKGWFKDTIPSYLKGHPQLKISLLHIDCDLYESTIDCFPQLFDFVSDHGVAVFDDFNDGAKGEKIAVLEALKTDYTIHTGPTPQAYLIKEKYQKSGIADTGFYYSFDEILTNNAYLNWLNKVSKIDYKALVQQMTL